MVLGILLLQFLTALALMRTLNSWQDRASFGEMFGGLAALFSGLAFAGVIYTILLQREELSLQRRELELTREELARAASAQERSQRALENQVALSYAAARVSALAAIVQHYGVLIKAAPSASAEAAAEQERIRYVESLKAALESLERASG